MGDLIGAICGSFSDFMGGGLGYLGDFKTMLSILLILSRFEDISLDLAVYVSGIDLCETGMA